MDDRIKKQTREVKRLIGAGRDAAVWGRGYEQAQELFNRAVEAAPDDARVWHERALNLINLDRPKEAVADFDRALALDPNFPVERSWLAQALAAVGDHRRAAEEWLRHLRGGTMTVIGAAPQEWAECAGQFVLAGDPETAVAVLEEYLAESADKVTFHIQHEAAPLRLLAELHTQAGNARRAAELWRRAVACPHQRPDRSYQRLIPADNW